MGPLLADDADRLAVDGGLAAHGLGAVERLEVEEVAVVDEPRDHLAQ